MYRIGGRLPTADREPVAAIHRVTRSVTDCEPIESEHVQTSRTCSLRLNRTDLRMLRLTRSRVASPLADDPKSHAQQQQAEGEKADIPHQMIVRLSHVMDVQ